jgi:hypothetical protein
MKNWKTTLGGILVAVGTFLTNVDDPAWVNLVGQVFVAGGAFLVGGMARDHNVTSESSGAK